MLTLSTEQLRPGMVLAAPIPHPAHPERELLRLGFTLDRPVIDKMRDLGLLRVHVAVPGLEDIDRHLGPLLTPARRTCLLQIKQAIDAVEMRTSPAIGFDQYCATTRKLITAIMLQGRHPAYIEQISTSTTDALLHSAAVAQLSLMLGLQLGDYLVTRRSRLPAARARDVVGLGVAAMLHDIGITMLPPHARQFCDTQRPTDPNIAQLYETHSLLGAESVRHDVEATVTVAILQHHWHADGSGFPRGDLHVKDAKPHVFSQIILAADLFDRLANPHHDLNRSNAEVLRLINGTYSQWIERAIVQAINSVVPVFPPGSIVQLSDGSSAVVLDFDPDDPYGPLVQRIESSRMVPLRPAFRVTADEGPQIVSSSNDVSKVGAA